MYVWSPWVPRRLHRLEARAPREPSGHPASRRYSPSKKEQAVRLMRQLRTEVGIEHGTVQSVAKQRELGVESVRASPVPMDRHRLLIGHC